MRFFWLKNPASHCGLLLEAVGAELNQEGNSGLIAGDLSCTDLCTEYYLEVVQYYSVVSPIANNYEGIFDELFLTC